MFGRAISARGGTTRKHWSRFFVLLTVLGVFAFAASLRSASPATAEAPKPVEVVNVPTVNAQQSGSWNVGINANVNIGNVPSNPVPIRVVDNAARQPFQTGCPAGISGGSRHGEGSFTVPADKRLVIEYVGATSQFPQSFFPITVELATRVGNSNPVSFGLFSITFAKSASGALSGTFSKGQTTRIYADPGTTVTRDAVVSDAVEVNAVRLVNFQISGYLIDP